MLIEYIDAAMRQAQIECDEDGRQYIGTIPDCQGVIGIGDTEESCRRDTQEVLEEWILVRVKSGHRLPVIDGIDVNPSLEPA